MSETQSARESLKQYEEQLLQVREALTTASESERESLTSLQSDLVELIHLTKEALGGENEDAKCNKTISNREPGGSSLDDEYDLFKAELAQLEEPQNDNSSESVEQSANSLEEDLKALEGTKCRAPHGSSWGGTGYHNAMICSVHKSDDEINSLNDIMVKVLFINPTHKEMLPCPYFLSGTCKFSEDLCHFSHGELVPFTSIQEYKEPDYSNIKMGSRVLAKHKNKLWHRCVVLRVPDDKDDEYNVKFEASGQVMDVGIDDLVPLDDTGLAMSDSSDDSEYEQEMEACTNEQVVQNALLSVNCNERLGDWEKHTRGIGSKLMAQMGYITGTGLGKRADGRVNPVEATVLPAGKSLDHCMTLRENAGGDKNLFSVERKMQKQKKKLEIQRKKEYLKEKQREKHNVFNFLNATLGNKPSEPEAGNSKSHGNLKKESNKDLSIANYKIGRDIERLEKESVKLRSDLKRFSQGSVQHGNILSQYNNAQKQISNLKASEKRIAAEQSHRKFKAKLTEF